MSAQKGHLETNWLSPADQQHWFDRYKSNDAEGIRFNKFQEFLKATIYQYLTSGQVDEENGAAQKFTNQQEMQIFKAYDVNNDHAIDRDEFGQMCQKWLENTYKPSCALVVVDVQNDFIDGSLALINGPAGQDGAEVVPIINDLIDKCPLGAVVYTQDWHPANHIGFHSNLHLRKYKLKTNTNCTQNNSSAENGDHLTGALLVDDGGSKIDGNNNGHKKMDGVDKFKLKKLTSKVQVFDTVLFDDSQMEQKLWPIHCIQNSWGAQLHPKLRVVPDAIRVHKGTLPHVDAYSAFWDNMRLNETNLRQELLSRKINDLFFCGLALDYCVAASAIDSARAGFITFVVVDACRGIDEKEMGRRKEEMIANGVLIIDSNFVRSYLTMCNGQKFDDGNNRDADEGPFESELFVRNIIKNVCLRKALS